jgi:hypothetical protein
MNKQINKLFGQALDEIVPSTWTNLTQDQLNAIKNRFAELLVLECVQAFESEVDTWKQMDPYQGSIKRQGTKAIKQHFGVEE